MSLDILKPILSLENIKFITYSIMTLSRREQFFKQNNISIIKIEEIDSFNDITITSLIDACDLLLLLVILMHILQVHW